MEGVVPSEEIHASAVRFLIDGQEEDAASILLSCSFKYLRRLTWQSGGISYEIELVGPRVAYDALTENESPIYYAIKNAFDAVLPSDQSISSMSIRAERISLDPDWHKELLEIARGRGIHNQLAEARPAQTWNNLRFRSVAEVRIAKALDKAGVFFLPNCLGRLGVAGKRENKEPDFLVCYEGKWGILEVDGEPFHPPTRTVQDHERDRLFKQHGIRVVEHYDAHQCYEHAEEIVQGFLELVRKQS